MRNKKTSGETNWLLKSIVGGLIALGVAIGSYYYTHQPDGGSAPTNEEQMNKDRETLQKQKG